jgi:hypothetical protein
MPENTADSKPDAGSGNLRPGSRDPTNPDGEAHGPRPDPAPEDVAVLQARGEPGTLPETWCKVCKARVRPVGKGRCERCGTFLKLNFIARRHPVNKLRVQQIEDQLVAEYQPRTLLQRSSCEDLAGIREKLETTKPGSQEHKRLVELSQQLGASLEKARPFVLRNLTPIAPAPSLTPTEQDFLAALRAPMSADIDERIEQVSVVLRQLLTARDEHTVEHDPVPAPPVESDPPSSEAIEVPEPATDTEGGVEPPTTDGAPVSELPVTAAAPPEPEPTAPPEPRCEYCRQTIERCAEIKEQHPDAFAALHHDDPDEVERRQEEATAIMMRQVGRGLPRWYR